MKHRKPPKPTSRKATITTLRRQVAALCAALVRRELRRQQEEQGHLAMDATVRRALAHFAP